MQEELEFKVILGLHSKTPLPKIETILAYFFAFSVQIELK
jgi:hypothetical protein